MPIIHYRHSTQDSPAIGPFNSAALSLWCWFLLCLTWALPAATQQNCPAPWATASNVYGIVVLEGTGSGQAGGYTQTVNQHAVAAGKLAGLGSCVWEVIPQAGFGVMKSQGNINDTVIYTPNGTFFNWLASGIGDPVWDSLVLQIIPAAGQYNVGAYGAVPGKFASSGGNANEDIIWGSTSGNGGVNQQNLPFPPSAPFLFGTASFQLPPFDNAQGNPGTINANWTETWAFSPLPDGTCEHCKQGDPRGSFVSVRSQSLAEDIPIVGTPFLLHYESERSAGRAAADPVAIRDAMSLGGWTLSVHHALEPLLMAYCAGGSCTPYSIVPKALFLGDGKVRTSAEVQAPLIVGSNLQLTSEDGSEIYVFDATSGKHVQTLRPMTGAVIYNFAYDANGLLVTITDGSDNVTTIQRGPKGLPIAIVSPYGQTTTLGVNNNGYLSKVTDPLGNSIKLTNTALGLLTSLKDRNGNLYSFQYDTNGFLTQDSDPAGGILNLARANSGSGYGVTETTAQGRTSNDTVAFSNNSSSTTQSFNNTWTNGLQASESDSQRNGLLSESAVLPNGTSYSKTYGPDPRWGVQLPIDTNETLTYGNHTMTISNNRTASLSNPSDPFSLVTQTDSETINGRTYTSVFTGATKTSVDTTPVGRKTTTVFDVMERVSSIQPPAGMLTSFVYDSRGRLGSATQGSRQTTYSYDANGRLAGVTDPLNLNESFTYDADGNLLTKTLQDGRVITYSYDNNGNLASVTPPAAAAHGFTYSPVNLPISYSPPTVNGGGSMIYSFSADRELTKLTRPDGQIVNYNYDVAGRVKSLVTPGATFNFTYNSTTGNLTRASVSGGEVITYSYNGPLPTSSTWTGPVAGTVTRTYNNNFWVTSLSLNGSNTAAFTYDQDGLMSKAGALTLNHNAKTALYTGSTLAMANDTVIYNAFAETSSYTAKFGTTVLYKAVYTRDNVGKVTRLSETIGGATTSYTYTFDQADRLTDVKKGSSSVASYAYDSNSNRLTATTSSGTVNASYDAQDRLLTYGNKSFTYTANGELAAKSQASSLTTYQYDVLGNLTSVSLPNGTQVTYVVDAESNRVGKKVNGILVAGYLYDGRDLVAQLDGNNQILSQFIYASGGNTPDYMVRGGVTYRIFSDHVGNPRLVVNASTGQVAQRMDYDEFGNVINDTNPGFQPFGFAGGLYDQHSKLVRFGARDYDAVTGRWTAKDPISFSGGDTNLYGYVLNDPVNMVDPAGLEGDCICQNAAWNAAWGFLDRAHEIVLGPVIWPIGASQAIAGYAVGANTFGHAVRMGISAVTGTPSSVDSNSGAFLGGVLGADVAAAIASGRLGASAELARVVNAARDARAATLAKKAVSVANLEESRAKNVAAGVEKAEKAREAASLKVCDPGKGVVRGVTTKATR